MTIAHIAGLAPSAATDGASVLTNRQRLVFVSAGMPWHAEPLAELYRRLAPRTIWLRYGAPWRELPEPVVQGELRRVLGGDPQLSAALVASNQGGEAVGVAELVQAAGDRSVAELALLVRDDYQREGLGLALGRMLHAIAQARGVRQLRIYTLPENVAIVRLVRRLGARYNVETRQGQLTIHINLP